MNYIYSKNLRNLRPLLFVVLFNFSHAPFSKICTRNVSLNYTQKRLYACACPHAFSTKMKKEEMFKKKTLLKQQQLKTMATHTPFVCLLFFCIKHHSYSLDNHYCTPKLLVLSLLQRQQITFSCHFDSCAIVRARVYVYVPFSC